MLVTETLSEGLKRAFSVVVPAADIAERRAKRLAELVKTVNLPGFRPGKVPLSVVKTRFGAGVTAEVLEETVNKTTGDLLDSRGLRSAIQPKVELVKSEDDGDLEFTVAVELLPTITMPDFSAIELTRMTATPSDEALTKSLEGLAQRQRELAVVEDVRPAAKGEFLQVDFLGKIDGIPFTGGDATDMDIEVGGDGFIPGFTDQLEGMSAGEFKIINVQFPEVYGSAELAGKAATFDITAKALKIQTLPTLDDSFAEKLGFGALDEVKDLIGKQMQREYDQLSRLKIKRQLLDALTKVAEFDVPPTLLEGEFAQIWQRVEADRKEGKLDADDAGKDDDTLKAEYLAIAERRVKLGLLLAEIGRVNGILVTEDELARAMRAEAGRYQGQEQMVMDFFRKNPQAADNLRGPIFEEKVVDFVLELAKVTDQVVTPEELAKEPEAEIAA
jgi:trigger factor